MIDLNSFCERDRENAARLLQELDNLKPKPRKPRLPNEAEADWVSLKKIFGHSRIPADLAEVVEAAVTKLITRGDIPESARFLALEYWSGNTLAEGDEPHES